MTFTSVANPNHVRSLGFSNFIMQMNLLGLYMKHWFWFRRTGVRPVILYF
jgi:hypothetical protein